jgi:hypothetical protein
MDNQDDKATNDSEPNFSQDELNTCVKVLQQLSSHPKFTTLYQQPEFKPLRRSIAPFIANLQKRQFGGQDPGKYVKDQHKKLAKNERRTRERDLNK